MYPLSELGCIGKSTWVYPSTTKWANSPRPVRGRGLALAEREAAGGEEPRLAVEGGLTLQALLHLRAVALGLFLGEAVLLEDLLVHLLVVDL